jgi:hypothetical protein
MTQTLLTIFIPTLMVLVGILLNRNDSSRIEARISALEGRLDGRITALESRLHSDMMQVIGKLTELEVRVARLEQER